MTGEDLAMMAVPALLCLLLALAVLALGRAGGRGQRTYVIAGGILGLAMVLGLVVSAWFWGVGFDYADTGRRVPAYVDRLMRAGFWAAAMAYVGFLTAGLLAHHAHRNHTTGA